MLSAQRQGTLAACDPVFPKLSLPVQGTGCILCGMGDGQESLLAQAWVNIIQKDSPCLLVVFVCTLAEPLWIGVMLQLKGSVHPPGSGFSLPRRDSNCKGSSRGSHHQA